MVWLSDWETHLLRPVHELLEGDISVIVDVSFHPISVHQLLGDILNLRIQEVAEDVSKLGLVNLSGTVNIILVEGGLESIHLGQLEVVVSGDPPQRALLQIWHGHLLSEVRVPDPKQVLLDINHTTGILIRKGPLLQKKVWWHRSSWRDARLLSNGQLKLLLGQVALARRIESLELVDDQAHLLHRDLMLPAELQAHRPRLRPSQRLGICRAAHAIRVFGARVISCCGLLLLLLHVFLLQSSHLVCVQVDSPNSPSGRAPRLEPEHAR
mmetsp:Transcript_72895/g.170746  ORF Transcript_72895/g.170746 Transcript_72895/m.170746 type:complete len:268 (+) Transcript_72895:33-836(+)